MYPKYYISHFPGKNMDVVEIDPKSTELARKYFYLDDLINEYNLSENERLGLYNDDGRIFLANSNKKYDLIINDAFSGTTPAETLATREAIKEIKAHLSNNGIYVLNILGGLDKKYSDWPKSEYVTLKDVFPYVYVVKVNHNGKDFGNNLFFCSSKPLPITSKKIELDGTEFILTDDYHPIEQMIGNSYLEASYN